MLFLRPVEELAAIQKAKFNNLWRLEAYRTSCYLKFLEVVAMGVRGLNF